MCRSNLKNELKERTCQIDFRWGLKYRLYNAYLKMWTVYIPIIFSLDKYYFSAQLFIQVVIPNTCELMCLALLMLIKTTNLSSSLLIHE